MALVLSPPIHPGELLQDQFLKPLHLSAGALAKELGVPRTRIERIIKQQMGISTDTALRLARYFDTTPDLWLNMQKSFEIATEGAELKSQLQAIKPHGALNDNFAAWTKRVLA